MKGFCICYISDVFVCVVLSSQPKVQMNGFGICYILDVFVLPCHLSQSHKKMGLVFIIS